MFLFDGRANANALISGFGEYQDLWYQVFRIQYVYGVISTPSTVKGISIIPHSLDKKKTFPESLRNSIDFFFPFIPILFGLCVLL